MTLPEGNEHEEPGADEPEGTARAPAPLHSGDAAIEPHATAPDEPPTDRAQEPDRDDDLDLDHDPDHRPALHEAPSPAVAPSPVEPEASFAGEIAAPAPPPADLVAAPAPPLVISTPAPPVFAPSPFVPAPPPPVVRAPRAPVVAQRTTDGWSTPHVSFHRSAENGTVYLDLETQKGPQRIYLSAQQLRRLQQIAIAPQHDAGVLWRKLSEIPMERPYPSRALEEELRLVLAAVASEQRLQQY